jgi:hypothetical protein
MLHFLYERRLCNLIKNWGSAFRGTWRARGFWATGLAEQIKVVAGTRSQRYLQALRTRIPILPCFRSARLGIQQLPIIQ